MTTHVEVSCFWCDKGNIPFVALNHRMAHRGPLGVLAWCGKKRMITHVAIVRDGVTYSLPKPNRHHHILHSGMMAGKVGKERDTQGFVDEAGKFLTRKEAFVLATESGQINRRKGGYDGPDLYSEDLW